MNNASASRQLIELHVEGMSCGHCVRAVKEALMRGPGVLEADVDLDSGNARVWHEGLATFESLRAEVEEEGYTATER